MTNDRQKGKEAENLGQQYELMGNLYYLQITVELQIVGKKQYFKAMLLS